MAYLDQVTDIKVEKRVETRVFVYWKNTEEGRDPMECYERFGSNPETGIFYKNRYNPSTIVALGDCFFKDLEEIYRRGLKQENESQFGEEDIPEELRCCKAEKKVVSIFWAHLRGEKNMAYHKMEVNYEYKSLKEFYDWIASFKDEYGGVIVNMGIIKE